MWVQCMLLDDLQNFLLDENGQDLIEYGLLAAFVSLSVVAVLASLKGTLVLSYGNIPPTIDEGMQ